MRPLAFLLLASLAGCSSVLPVSGERRAAAAFLQDCDLPGVGGRALCGTFDVPENRERPGRLIPLSIVVLQATATAKPDPVVPLQGGPGQASTSLARFYARMLSDVRRDRDIILVDVRGTGRSNPLACSATSAEWLRSGELLPPDQVRACRDALQRRADLRRYTTAEIARDLDDVRQALGVERWNLYGSSYGTRLAQEYIRDFGAHVRTVTLSGVVAPSMAIPLPYARDSQAALDRLLDARTRALLPAVLSRLRAEPAVVPSAGGEIVISAGVFAEALRNLIYDPGSAPKAAAMIREGAAGHFTTAGEAVMRQRGAFTNGIALGMFLSVTCAEDIPRIDAATIDGATRGTFLGDYRVRQQVEACRHWPAGPSRPEASTPVTSDVPALLISGELDPVTPPGLAAEVLRSFSRALHVTVAGAGHAGAESACLTSGIREFIDRGGSTGVDLTCAGNISRR